MTPLEARIGLNLITTPLTVMSCRQPIWSIRSIVRGISVELKDGAGKTYPGILVDSKFSTGQSGHGGFVLEAGRLQRRRSNVVDQDLLQQIGVSDNPAHDAGGQGGESVVRRREDGERTRTAQSVSQTGFNYEIHQGGQTV